MLCGLPSYTLLPSSACQTHTLCAIHVLAQLHLHCLRQTPQSNVALPGIPCFQAEHGRQLRTSRNTCPGTQTIELPYVDAMRQPRASGKVCPRQDLCAS